MPPGKFLGQSVEEYLKAFRVGCGQDQKCARPVRGADGADRGRDAGYPAPPAQIRTGPIKAYGSHLGW
jgi:hypothetical protein